MGLLAGVACGDGADRGQTAPLSVPPAGTTPTATAVEAAPASAPLETIADVFACINPGAAGGLAEGREERPLIRHDLDLEQFPEARCNDGTAAVFYFRPYEGEENRDRWVVQLQGGVAAATRNRAPSGGAASIRTSAQLR